MTYDHNFYDLINNGSYQSAKVVWKLIKNLLWDTEINSIVDIGCGEGAWLVAAKEIFGALDIWGWDGHDHYDRLLIDKKDYCKADLATAWLETIFSFDICMSLEVAEHLPESSADGFVAGLCSESDIVLFSAAIPGQKGVGHINEQWPSYWDAKFNQHGFFGTEIIRRSIWDDPNVENWYKQNILLYIKNGPTKYGRFEYGVLDVVHPSLWYDHHLRPVV